MSKHFLFPKPKDWNTFEDIVADVFSRKYRNHNLQRYGRRGQPQHGVDIAGPVQEIGVLGIQCKHRSKEEGTLSTSEISAEIAESAKFRPTLGEYVIATSADRDTTLHDYVFSTSEARKLAGKYPVTIKFWEDILDWLTDYPDLVYKHFTKHFPVSELEHLSLPTRSSRVKQTISWPATLDELRDSIVQSEEGVEVTEPYKATLGLTTFEDVTFAGLVDVEIQLSSLFASGEDSQASFLSAAQTLSEFRAAISDTFFSRDLFVHLQTRLTLAFLLGWVFRSVTHFNLTLISQAEIWATSGLPHVPSRLTEALPRVLSPESTELEVVLILNINRDITSSVNKFVDKWDKPPTVIVAVDLDSRRVESAAHALSIAKELAQKIKSINDKWNASHIHLFGSMPAPLAALTSHFLNAICPITIYYMDSSRQKYRPGGTINNNL